MFPEKDPTFSIAELSKLKAVHFADLIRAAQLIFDPGKGVSGATPEVDWKDFGVPDDIAENLRLLGEKYRYASPHTPVEKIWSELEPKTRIWFVENKDRLWVFEESFPALDED
ncbi:MAG: hypothetical protein ACFB02_01750 [Mastigocoleus sp.]